MCLIFRFECVSLFYKNAYQLTLNIFKKLIAISVIFFSPLVFSESEVLCETFFSSSQVYNLDSLDKNNRVNHAEGKVIQKINFYLLDVFDESDEDENNFVFRFLNKVHINTQEYVIRDQLLFDEGQVAQVSTLIETERLLRKKRYLTDAFILPEKVCGDSVEIAVITRDTWALELEASFGESGGETKSSIGFKSGNLLGTGNLLTVEHVTEDGHSKVVTKTENPSLFGSRFSSAVAYADTSEGEEKHLTLNRHFYSLNSKWSFESEFTSSELLENEKDLNGSSGKYFEKNGLLNIAYGFSDGLIEGNVTRYYFGLTQDKFEFRGTDNTEGALPDNRIRNYAWAGINIIENKYEKFRNIHQIQRTEDIQLGQEFKLNFGIGPKGLNNDKAFFYSESSYENAISIGKHHLTKVGVSYEGNYLTETKKLENYIFGTKLDYYHYLNENQRWYMGLKFDKGVGLTADQELTFEDKTIVRGYPSYHQKGNRRLLASLEHRRFYNTHIFNIIRVGRVFFADVARAWDSENEAESPLLSDIGFGLRFSSSKVRVGNVAHMDIAFPLSDKSSVDSYQFTLKAFHRF